MKTFDNSIAVITGGGSGIGRELAKQLAAAGCHLALCDLDEEGLAGTAAACGNGVRVSTHRCDVSSEADLVAFRDAMMAAHDTGHINLLFNNAGVSGGQSFVNADRDEWDRTFAICWEGVYLGCRVFLPLLMASDAGHIINISSVNGMWACLGPNTEHTAYSAAKFAVRGFTEALIVDLRLNAPHIGVSVVMPGHIGTPIVANTQKMWTGGPAAMDAAALDEARARFARVDPAASQLDDEAVRSLLEDAAEQFQATAPTTAAQAATVILDGVRDNRWRILVGDDAVGLDEALRANPEAAYDDSFSQPFSVLDSR